MGNQKRESLVKEAASTPNSAEGVSVAEIRKVVTVRTFAEILSHQPLSNFIGISGQTAGAKGISMNLIVIPPGEASEPHFHYSFETVLYLLKGQVKTLYGAGLKQSVINHEGDFIFIPPNLPHQSINLSATEPVYAIMARNDPHEQENSVHYEATIESE